MSKQDPPLSHEIHLIRWAFDRGDSRQNDVEALSRRAGKLEREHAEMLEALKAMCGDGVDGGIHYECRCVGCEAGRALVRGIKGGGE